MIRLLRLEPGVYEVGTRYRVERVGTQRHCVWVLLERRRGAWTMVETTDTLYAMRSLLGALIRRKRESCSATPRDPVRTSSRTLRSAQREWPPPDSPASR